MMPNSVDIDSTEYGDNHLLREIYWGCPRRLIKQKSKLKDIAGNVPQVSYCLVSGSLQNPVCVRRLSRCRYEISADLEFLEGIVVVCQCLFYSRHFFGTVGALDRLREVYEIPSIFREVRLPKKFFENDPCLDDDRFFGALYFAQLCVGFVLMHELAHVYRNHFDIIYGLGSFEIAMSDFSEEAVPQDVDRDVYLACEFDADVTAAFELGTWGVADDFHRRHSGLAEVLPKVDLVEFVRDATIVAPPVCLYAMRDRAAAYDIGSSLHGKYPPCWLRALAAFYSGSLVRALNESDEHSSSERVDTNELLRSSFDAPWRKRCLQWFRYARHALDGFQNTHAGELPISFPSPEIQNSLYRKMLGKHRTFCSQNDMPTSWSIGSV